MKIEQSVFGYTKDGEEVIRYQLTNDHKVSIALISYGATWQDWCYQQEDEAQHFILSHPTVSDYEENPFHLGNTIGRVAGRIRDASFTLEGKQWQLPANQDGHLLHSGAIRGFDTYCWQGSPCEESDEVSVTFSMTTADDGFPGTMACQVTYTLTNDNEVVITYEGISDETTLFNPMTHVYLTLNNGNELLGTQLQVNSESHLEVDEDKIPTGRFIANEGGFALQAPQSIDEVLQEVTQLDDAFVVEPRTKQVILTNGHKRIEVSSDRNAAVIFTANPYQPEEQATGIAVEMQMLPDAIHHEHFGNIILPKQKTKRYQTVYQLFMEASD